ncbi:MAG: molybdate ABC transporter substrate-binding protein, partial [Deferribacterales bacterium]|nr:molybdate ABC transporter substrate-binding protein [Deferribacterales bacterium]
RIETIPLTQEELSRIGYIPIAISKFTKNMGLAQKFIDFLDTEEAKSVYRKYKYFMTPEEAKSWIGVEKPIGGEYKVPEIWLKK